MVIGSMASAARGGTRCHDDAAMAQLLSIDEARAAVLDAVAPLEAEAISVADALGRVLAEEIVTTGGDDFHCYVRAQPRLRSAMLGVGVGLSPGLHVPTVTYETGPLPTASAILARALELAAARA